MKYNLVTQRQYLREWNTVPGGRKAGAQLLRQGLTILWELAKN